MILLDWYQQWLSIRAEFKAKKFELTREVKQESIVCQSCETLKSQLDIANYEKKQLLNRILEKPEPVEERKIAPEPSTVRLPRNIPWPVRRQMLETEDREKARAMREAPKPDAARTAEVTRIEQELGIAPEASQSNAG